MLAIMLGTLRLAGCTVADSITTREQLVRDDQIASNFESSLSTRRQAGKLTALVGRPCADVRPALTELDTYVRYARAVALVANGRLLFASGVGEIDLLLSRYLNSHRGPFEIGLLSQTTYQPSVPVLAMVHTTGQGAGLLHVIASEDIAEILAHGSRLNVPHLGITVDETHFSRDTGIIQTAPIFESVAASRLPSKPWPYQITLTSRRRFDGL
ncbi:CSS-motif domain-containing protein [Caballeronia sp. RCC_10]|uniref:CSS-motif domain-containing protein n=1 Tax=Caballeronia sp. RCC_10 TaxID=3239227 RepID=UPI003526B7DD